jgi:hypothetical protein
MEPIRGQLELSDLTEKDTRVPDQRQAMLGQAHAAGPSLEEVEPELALERADVLAHGWLREVEMTGGLADTSDARDGHEGPQLMKFHGRGLSLASGHSMIDLLGRASPGRIVLGASAGLAAAGGKY